MTPLSDIHNVGNEIFIYVAMFIFYMVGITWIPTILAKSVEKISISSMNFHAVVYQGGTTLQWGCRGGAGRGELKDENTGPCVLFQITLCLVDAVDVHV